MTDLPSRAGSLRCCSPTRRKPYELAAEAPTFAGTGAAGRGIGAPARRRRAGQGAASRAAIDAFMQEYSLSSEEGVVLMCLAEALLRIPDSETQDRLIADKIGGKRLGPNRQIGIALRQRFRLGVDADGPFRRTRQGRQGGYRRLYRRADVAVGRAGHPQAMRQAMRIMGKQFVLGRTIEEALKIAEPLEARVTGFPMTCWARRHSPWSDADRYLASYQNALQAVGASGAKIGGDIFDRPSMSVKLSALHPRYEEKQKARFSPSFCPAYRSWRKRQSSAAWASRSMRKR